MCFIFMSRSPRTTELENTSFNVKMNFLIDSYKLQKKPEQTFYLCPINSVITVSPCKTSWHCEIHLAI